jgi:hypothetical protein
MDQQQLVNLLVEHRIVLLGARRELTADDRAELRRLLTSCPSWGRMIEVALFNKVLPMLAAHLLQYTVDVVPGLVRKQMLFAYLGNQRRNAALFAELRRIVGQLRERGLVHSPLKGAYLIPYVYRDPGLRMCNDLDILIHTGDFAPAAAVMESLGYVMGRFDDPSGTVKPASRAEDLLWKRHMGNIHPFARASDEPFLAFTSVDFAFDVDPIHRNPQAAAEMLSRTREITINDFTSTMLSPEDFLIHVCAHLYKEACSEFAAEDYSQLNLIKFCDVRELVHHEWRNVDQPRWDALFQRAAELQLLHTLLYAFEGVAELYADAFFAERAAALPRHAAAKGDPPSVGSHTFWNTMFPGAR